jgi:hypothetical protein
MVNGWLEADYSEWQPVLYNLWDVVKFENAFYTLLSLEDFDNSINPFDSECWGAIADYSPEHNAYELSAHEYVVRIRDYEDSMKWLSDAARLKLNPQIPRKLAEDKKPVTDWQMATFQTDYDPYKNPWLT